MNEYTPPTIERIREELPELTKEIRKRASILGAETTAGQLNGWKFSAELADLFDRWLAEVKAQVWDEAERRGRDNERALMMCQAQLRPSNSAVLIKNPYRQGEEQ